METTTNIKLKKPQSSDAVNIADLNYNADVIDTEIPKTLTAARQYSDNKILMHNMGTTAHPTIAADIADIKTNITTIETSIAERALKSKSAKLTLPFSRWELDRNHLYLPWNVDWAAVNGSIGLSLEATFAEITAASLAQFSFEPFRQEITVIANGEIPKINIPIVVTIVG